MVGETMPKPREEDIPLDPGDVIVLHTDGLSSRFGPDDYPGLMRDDPEQTVRRYEQKADALGPELDQRWMSVRVPWAKRSRSQPSGG